MLKKVVYGLIAGSLVIAVQNASAESLFWNGERYESVTEGILSVSSAAEPVRYAAATNVMPMEQGRDWLESDESAFPPHAQTPE